MFSGEFEAKIFSTFLFFGFYRRFAGFDVMTLANNHMNDYGEKPINLTRTTLKRLGIKTFGISYGPFDASQVSDVTMSLNQIA